MGQCGHGRGLPRLAGTIGTLDDNLSTLLSVDKAKETLSLSTKVALSRPGSRKRKVVRSAAAASMAARAFPRLVV